MKNNIFRDLQNYCLEALELEKEDLRAVRMFEFKEKDYYPVVFLFQKDCSMDYYLCLTNVDEPKFEKLPTHQNENHHQSRIQTLKNIVGFDVAFELIKQGLFYSDKKKKRINDNAIKCFLNSKSENDNSSFQIHRLVSLLKYKELNHEGIEVHHIDLNSCNNRDNNTIPIPPSIHTGKNSIHYLNGEFRSDSEVIKLGNEYKEQFLNLYNEKFPPCKATKYEDTKAS